MHVLVTGANGFVGAALCKKLLENGESVRGLVRGTSDLSLLEGADITLEYGSLSDRESLGRAAAGADLIFHVAAAVSDWGSMAYFRSINVEGTRNVLDAAAAAGVKRVVLVSSVAVHSFIDARNMDEGSPQEPTPYPYCQTKREAEALALDYHHRGGVEVAIARPGDVWGPGDRTSLLKMASMLKNGAMGYIGGGRKLGAFSYIENLVDGIILCGYRAEAVGEAFIITDGTQMTWRTYFEKLTDAIGVPRPRFSLHPALAWGLASLMEAVYSLFRISSRPPLTRYLVDHMRCDTHFSIAKARKLLGYEPAVNTDEGIRRTAAWFRSVVGDGKK
ncbi:NAD-dependent epimerase/dehydratase family protein [bacterium]|nr:NAD-dependent epimerase/dehydratase family protein [bacterium]